MEMWTEIEPRPTFILSKMQEVVGEESKKAVSHRGRAGIRREKFQALHQSQGDVWAVSFDSVSDLLQAMEGVSKRLTALANWLLLISVLYLHFKCKESKHLPLWIPLPELNTAKGKSLLSFWKSLLSKQIWKLTFKNVQLLPGNKMEITWRKWIKKMSTKETHGLQVRFENCWHDTFWKPELEQTPTLFGK